MIERFEKFIGNITEIDLYWHRLASGVMRKYGLKGNYVVYFTVLNKYPDGLTATELASGCVKDKADVSRDISVLERDGYVIRSTEGQSGYRAKIKLSEQGKSLTKIIISKAELAVSCIGGSLDENERDCFYKVFDEIAKNMHILSLSGIPDTDKEL